MLKFIIFTYIGKYIEQITVLCTYKFKTKAKLLSTLSLAAHSPALLIAYFYDTFSTLT
jgi:hypothetical protein